MEGIWGHTAVQLLHEPLRPVVGAALEAVQPLLGHGLAALREGRPQPQPPLREAEGVRRLVGEEGRRGAAAGELQQAGRSAPAARWGRGTWTHTRGAGSWYGGRGTRLPRPVGTHEHVSAHTRAHAHSTITTPRTCRRTDGHACRYKRCKSYSAGAWPALQGKRARSSCFRVRALWSAAFSW